MVKFILSVIFIVSTIVSAQNNFGRLIFDDSFNALQSQINSQFANIQFPSRQLRYEVLRLNFLLGPRPIDPLAVQYVASQIFGMLPQGAPEYDGLRQSVIQLVTSAANQAQNNPGLFTGNVINTGSSPIIINPGASPSSTQVSPTVTSTPTPTTSSSSTLAPSPTATVSSVQPSSSSMTSTSVPSSSSISSTFTVTSPTPAPSMSPSVTGPPGNFINVTGGPTTPDSPFNPKNVFKPPFQPTQQTVVLNASVRSLTVSRIFSSLSVLAVLFLML